MKYQEYDASNRNSPKAIPVGEGIKSGRPYAKPFFRHCEVNKKSKKLPEIETNC